jgi:hypothetical protein
VKDYSNYVIDGQGGETMTADETGGNASKKREAGEGLGDDDDRIFHLWLESLVLQDPRYNSKAIAVLAREAMVNEQLRSRVVSDPESCLRELGYKLALPEGMAVRFLDNTQATLNVVLPPRAGGAGRMSPALRDRLRSRTSTSAQWFSDDWDTGPFMGDPEERDPPIFQ